GALKGLEGSTLNAGNFSASRRSFGDTWVKPMLQDLSASLSAIINVPADAELWYDASGISLLHEDAKDAAEVQFIQSQAIRQLIESGFDPDSAVAAVHQQDPTLLRHTGLVSVQLQEPGSEAEQPSSSAQPP